MEVLLLKNVPGLGTAGQTKKVAEGYARNHLLPRKLAVLASDSALKQAEALKQAAVRREAKTRGEAEELAALIKQTVLTFRAKAGEGDRLFGSITSGDISDALARERKIIVDKRKIELEDPIKQLGTHAVGIKLHADVTATVTVIVEKEAV